MIYGKRYANKAGHMAIKCTFQDSVSYENGETCAGLRNILRCHRTRNLRPKFISMLKISTSKSVTDMLAFAYSR